MDDALEVINEGLRLNLKDDFCWSIKGSILQNLSDYQGAVIAYEHALKIDPSDDDNWHDKGLCLMELAKFDDAIQAFQQEFKESQEKLNKKLNE